MSDTFTMTRQEMNDRLNQAFDRGLQMGRGGVQQHDPGTAVFASDVDEARKMRDSFLASGNVCAAAAVAIAIHDLANSLRYAARRPSAMSLRVGPPPATAPTDGEEVGP